MTPQATETPAGARPGTVFTTTYACLVGMDSLYHLGLRMSRVAAAPSTNEYTYSGSTITMGHTVNAGEAFLFDGYL